MINCKKLLTYEEASNEEIVRDYITKSFNKRRPQKSKFVYINLSEIYCFFPKLVTEILDNIGQLGYYKDYFHILSYSLTDNLNDYIYTKVASQINDDLVKLGKKREISTLGKWLPSENSKINRKINFIDKFNVVFFKDTVPNINSGFTKFTLRKKYRQIKTKINQYLGTLETLMSLKEYDKVNLNKVSPNALKRHKHHLMQVPEMRKKINEFELDKLIKMSLVDFIKELFSDNYDIQTLEQVWMQNNYNFKMPYVNQIINNAVCVIDLSKDAFNNNSHYMAIGMALLTNKLSKFKDIIVCKNNVVTFDKNDSLIEKKNKLLKYCGPCSETISPSDYKQLININEKYTLLFVTPRKILCVNNIDFTQIIPYYNNNYEIIHFTNNKVKKNLKIQEDILTSDKINIIVNNSEELNDNRSHLIFILCVLWFWMAVKIMEFRFSF